MGENLVGTVRIYLANRSFVFTIPHHLREGYDLKKGDHFAVKTDERGRIIYEKISGGQGAATNELPACQTPTLPRDEVSR